MQGLQLALKGWTDSTITVVIDGDSDDYTPTTDVQTVGELADALAAWVRSSARPWVGAFAWCEASMVAAGWGLAPVLALSGGSVSTFDSITATGSAATWIPSWYGSGGAVGCFYVPIDTSGWSRWDKSGGAITGAGMAWTSGLTRYAARRPEVAATLYPEQLYAFEAATRYTPRAGMYAQVYDPFRLTWRAVTYAKVDVDPTADLTRVSFECLASPDALPTGETWGTAYLDGNGAVDAVATGAATAVDTSSSIWTLITLAAPASGGSHLAGGSSGASEVVRCTFYPTPDRIFGGVNVGGWKTVQNNLPTSDTYAAGVIVDRAADTTSTYTATPGGTNTAGPLATGAETLYADDIQIGSLKGGSPYTGRIYGALVLLTTPLTTELQALALGHSPWDVWPAADIAHAWIPALAYEGHSDATPLVGGGYFWIPDVAESRGGIHAAVHALMAGGDLSDIVGV